MTIVLWGGLVAWLGVIYYLSSQNGEQTAQTSLALTHKLAAFVFENPTDAQLADFHMILRKFAHLFLFFLLGSLTTWVSAVTFPKGKGILSGYYVLISMGMTLAAGYFDEWHKQFIAGRHFDFAETMLNLKAGACGVIFAMVVILVCKGVRMCMEE